MEKMNDAQIISAITGVPTDKLRIMTSDERDFLDSYKDTIKKMVKASNGDNKAIMSNILYLFVMTLTPLCIKDRAKILMEITDFMLTGKDKELMEQVNRFTNGKES